MPIDRQFAGHVINLFGDIFADTNLLPAAVTDLGFLRNVMGNFGAGKVLRYLAPAVTTLSFVLFLLVGGRGIREAPE